MNNGCSAALLFADETSGQEQLFYIFPYFPSLFALDSFLNPSPLFSTPKNKLIISSAGNVFIHDSPFTRFFFLLASILPKNANPYFLFLSVTLSGYVWSKFSQKEVLQHEGKIRNVVYEKVEAEESKLWNFVCNVSECFNHYIVPASRRG